MRICTHRLSLGNGALPICALLFIRGCAQIENPYSDPGNVRISLIAREPAGLVQTPDSIGISIYLPDLVTRTEVDFGDNRDTTVLISKLRHEQ
jgi:hypothetical protein